MEVKILADSGFYLLVCILHNSHRGITGLGFSYIPRVEVENLIDIWVY